MNLDIKVVKLEPHFKKDKLRAPLKFGKVVMADIPP